MAELRITPVTTSKKKKKQEIRITPIETNKIAPISKTHAQQYNLDGSKKIAPTVSTEKKDESLMSKYYGDLRDKNGKIKFTDAVNRSSEIARKTALNLLPNMGLGMVKSLEGVVDAGIDLGLGTPSLGSYLIAGNSVGDYIEDAFGGKDTIEYTKEEQDVLNKLKTIKNEEELTPEEKYHLSSARVKQLEGADKSKEKFKIFQESVRNNVAKDTTEEYYNKLYTPEIKEELEKNSLITKENFGGKASQAVGQGVLQAFTANLLGGGNFGTTAVTIAPSAYGSGVEQAYNDGATTEQARLYGLGNAAVEILTEKITGGLPGTKGKGGLDYLAEKGIKKISNETIQELVRAGYKVNAEGFEEGLAEILDTYVKKATYDPDAEIDINAVIESHVLGMISAGVIDAPSNAINIKQGMTNQKIKNNEFNQKLIEKETNELVKEIETEKNRNLSQEEVSFVRENIEKNVNKLKHTLTREEIAEINNEINNSAKIQQTTQETNSNTPQISQEIGQNQELSNETINTPQTVETPKNNIKSYTENDINRFSTGNNLIDGVNSDLKSFTEKFYDKETKRAKKKKAPTKSQKMFLGRISDALSTKINSLLNNSGRFSQKYETKDTNIVISSDNIEHIYNHHGSEKMPGQIDVTPENLSKYVDVVSNPDYIGLSSQLSRGNTPTLYFTKKINGYSVAVEVLSTKKQLYPQSYYVFDSNSKEYTDFIKNNKLKKAWDVESGDFKSSDINVQDDTSAAFTGNNDTTKPKKSQIAPLSSQYSMQQNKKNDTKAPISKENNEINERIEKDDAPDVITYKVSDKITRKQVRQQLLDEMDITAEELSIGDDINPINFQLTDPIRVNEKVFGRELGKKINEATIEKTKHNTAEKTRWLNSERNDIKELGIKPRSKESAAVQKYGEKQYVNKYGETVSYGDVELANEFSNTETQEKIKRAAEVIRNKYDKYIDQINEVITALGYDEIPKRTDYMRHFQELGDIFSQTGVPFNLNDMKAEDLPTDINGLTEFNKPGKNWFASAQQRTGNKTTYDAITGIDGYLEGAGNLIYHTADIQRYRALSTLIRDSFGQSKGFENLDKLTNKEAEQRIKDIQNNKFSQYAAWLDEQANNLAGKKGAIDRATERFIGRKGYTFFNTLKKQVGSNMTGFNVRSALTNLISSTIASAKTNKIALAKGTISTIHNMFKNDSFIDKSDFLTSRFGSDSLSPKLWQKLSNAGQIFMTGTDYFTSNLIVRSKYYEGLQKGLSESDAIQYADDFGARVMGDRSQGSTAEIFNSKALGLLTQFQLEVNNQWQYMIHDTVMDYQKNSEINGGFKAGATALFQMGQLAAYSYLFNELFEALTGSRAAFDPIEILKKLFDDDDDKSWSERLWSATQEILDNLPMGNLISGTGNGRLPISSALPITSIISGKDSNGYDKSRLETLLETLPYYVLPTGYSQAKKTIQGLSMFSEDKEITGSYTKGGDLRFPVADTTPKKIQAGLFGQYASSEAREKFDNDYSALGENQQEMYKALNIPISDYWEIRKEINSIKAELKGTDKTDEERKKIFYKYIDSLNISNIKKSILKKSIYKSYDVADEEIKEYINSSNMSKQSKKDLLEELGLDK